MEKFLDPAKCIFFIVCLQSPSSKALQVSPHCELETKTILFTGLYISPTIQSTDHSSVSFIFYFFAICTIFSTKKKKTPARHKSFALTYKFEVFVMKHLLSQSNISFQHN